jgi:hypothetical protein
MRGVVAHSANCRMLILADEILRRFFKAGNQSPNGGRQQESNLPESV